MSKCDLYWCYFYTPCWYYADIILMINLKSYFDFCCWWWSNHRQCLMPHAQWNISNLLQFTKQICILRQLWNYSMQYIFWKVQISNVHENWHIYTGSTVILPIYQTTETNDICMSPLKENGTLYADPHAKVNILYHFTNILSLCSPHGSLLIRKSPRL